MPLLRLILRDRRVWLLAVLGLAAVVIGRWVVTPEQAVPLVAQAGYWFLLVTVVLFGRALWRLAAERWATGWRPGRMEASMAALVLASWGLWMAHEERGYKILADELLLNATSMGMHYEREVALPVRGTDVRGPWQFPEKLLDKRPYFFPFLVSLVHDVTGYRPTNAFAVNAGLGLIFLTLLFSAGRQIAGTPWAGALLVLLFAGVPLLAQQAVGGGFELLNVTLMLALFLLGARYLERPDVPALEALCFGAVLLAFARYESVVFVFPVAVLVLLGWQRTGRVVLSAPTVLTPVLLLPYLLQNLVFSINPDLWQMQSKVGVTTPFSLEYLPGNLGHALAFFLDTSGYQGNSAFFGVLGLLTVPFFFLLIVRWLRRPVDATPVQAALACISLGLAAIWALLMVYFWGQFDDPVIRRLSLPVQLLMGFAIVALVDAALRRHAVVWKILCGGAVFWLFFHAVPTMVRKAYFWEYLPGIEMAWRAEFLSRHPERNYLFIDRDATFWITEHVAATPVQQAGERKEGLAYHLRNHSFSAMYVFQRFKVDDRTGELLLEPKDDVGPDYELQPVVEKRIGALHLARISRVVAIREKGEVVARSRPFASETTTPVPEADLSKISARYLERWIKNLP